MGFNNGYDSGYSDCEAENRKRWEREAVERYKAENPSGGSSGGGSSTVAPSLPGENDGVYFEGTKLPSSGAFSLYSYSPRSFDIKGINLTGLTMTLQAEDLSGNPDPNPAHSWSDSNLCYNADQTIALASNSSQGLQQLVSFDYSNLRVTITDANGNILTSVAMQISME